ncbi:MAG TPA: DUF1003 domain-containing protein [Phenylobacterium sp.]|uniref:DUF1003 domain-containing protein n=1 Tax=Phenylobacterium sp. TaxID=1871053 RepID=UPI002D73AFAF|nr:DUF1003 domain-containing protein [Phenylobacterium sp.]HZZ70358.1 DUF1003 domain-containing protein [Phenylobacterium sp.]
MQAIARLHIDHRRGATGLQRTVERLTRFFSRPRAVGLLAVLVAAWLLTNVVMSALGGQPFDPAPFNLLQAFTGIAALFMTIFILVTQRREDELSELREQLTLELALLSEQKAAKLIELMEELRRDLPNVRDRIDHQASALSQAADPDAVLEVLKENQIEAADSRDGSADPGGPAPTSL